jgi:hypothetical protein
MKQKTLLSALGLLAVTTVVFFACQKDVKQGSLSVGTSSNLAAAPYSNLSFSQNPAPVGTVVTVSGSLTSDPNIPVCGTLRLEQAVDALNQPTSAALAVNWVPVASLPDGTVGTVSYDYVTTAAGAYGFRLHFIPNNGCQGQAYRGSPAPGFDLIVTEQTCAGLSVAASSAGDNGDGTLTVCFVVNTCGDTYTNIKLQGGLTANASALVTDGAVKITNKTPVINWKETSLTGTKTYCVTFKQTLKGTPPYKVTGAWSVVGTKDGVTTKSDYTAPVTFFP